VPAPDGDLRLDTHAGTLYLRAEPGGFVVSAAAMGDLRGVWSVMRGRGPLHGGMALVRRTGQRLRVIVRGHEIARIGPDAHPGLLSTLLGVPQAELRAWALARAFLGARGPHADA
jgi:hypothetical protein